MSEKYPGSHHEHLPSTESVNEHHHEHEARHHEHHKAEKAPDVEKARLKVEQAEKQAEKHHKIEVHDTSDRLHEPRQHYVNRELKEMAYTRVLNRTRKQLPAPARAFSKVIHQPVVNAVSEGLGKSVGRPSGIFGGGLIALIGTAAYYYLTKHYGYTYNYFVFVMLLVLGFLAGWCGELAWKLGRTTRR
jgi:hypothetical protein